MRSARLAAVFLSLLLGLAAGPALAQQDFDAVEIRTQRLAEGLYALEGQGGTIVVSAGADGVLVVDTQFAPLSERILAAIRHISDAPIRYVINTHHHGDHTGGNAAFAAAGATLIAHENAARRIPGNYAGPDGAPGAVPPGAVPTLTFTDTLTLHFNGEEIHLRALPPAHTDGDILVRFVNANVIHTGDVFRTISYPAVDTAGGGEFQGILYAYEVLQELTNWETLLVPGHGVVSHRRDMDDQLRMLTSFADQVAQAKAQGLSLDEVVALGLTAEYDERWSAGRWTGETVIAGLYEATP